MFSTRFNPFYEPVPEQAAPLSYKPKDDFIAERHTCTDIFCGLIFAVCLALSVVVAKHGFENGDPRLLYHGMDWQGNVCGVDLPSHPYVYWCQKMGGMSDAQVSDPNWTPSWTDSVTSLDFHHPICVTYCPFSASTEHRCYNSETGHTHLVRDYATHPIADRYCMPQSSDVMGTINDKKSAHPFSKYAELAEQTVREGYPVLIGSIFVAFCLSMMYLLLIECFAGCVIWGALMAMVVVPGASGGLLLYAAANGGMDGMPASGDDETDYTIGAICCAISAFFLLICCCMSGAINKAITVCECAAECLFGSRSLLLEPIFNLSARITLWIYFAISFSFVVTCGTVRKSKMYRTFNYDTEEWIMMMFYAVMMIWVNDFVTGMSQYVIANAASRWYFSQSKSAQSCLLCRAYFNGWLFHFGSIALGSLVISFTRPLRMVMLVLLYAGSVTDNAVCGCITNCCLCCTGCFESFLNHLCKNAYIDMAITSKGFCAAGTNAAALLKRQSEAIAASAGATWLFTIAGLGLVSTLGSSFAYCLVQNMDMFSMPTGRFYIQDPMVMAALAGIVSFFVALCFMIVFDAVADTLFICRAYDLEEEKQNPVPVYKAEPPPKQTVFMSVLNPMSSKMPPAPVARPSYAPEKFKTLFK